MTKVVNAIHQNHQSYKKKEKEEKLNLTKMCTLRDADLVLMSDGLKKPSCLHRIFSKLSLFYPWRLILGVKRKIQTII
jgi:hypothetical protein